MEEAHIPNTKKPSASTPKHSTFFQYFLWGGGEVGEKMKLHRLENLHTSSGNLSPRLNNLARTITLHYK